METFAIFATLNSKSQKTSSKEIARANEIMKAHFEKNKDMDKIKFYTHEEMKEEVIGKKGTSERDKYDERLDMFLIGEAIKRTRLEKNLTQEDLGNLVGVQKAQISRIENGKNLTFATVIRLFKAMGVSAKLEIGNLGKVALC